MILGTKKYEDGKCSPDERLNCFSHNNEHWKTAPFWTDGNFCACTNSNTNTYSCVRNVNGTHNYLYCEFVSGLITFYNLKVDPYQLRNIYSTLSSQELNFMHHQLAVLKNHGLKYSQMYSSFARQRNFNKRYGKRSLFFRFVLIYFLAKSKSNFFSSLKKNKYSMISGQFLPPLEAYQQHAFGKLIY